MVSTRNLRAIVKACLIVTLTLQQVAVGALPALAVSRCGTETLDANASSTEQKCSGCGHCTVNKVDQLCGCCATQPKVPRGTAPETADSKSASKTERSVNQSCCGGQQRAEPESVATHIGETQIAADALQDVAARKSHLLASVENRCRCVGGSPNRSIPYRGESRVQKDLTSLRAIAQVHRFGAIPSSQDNCTKADSASHSRSHFAQRLLCIWQI